MNPDKSTAIIKLVPGVSFSITPEGKIVKWNSDKEQPTEEEIQVKLKELQMEYDAYQYARNRTSATGYPSIQDQLDMQFWDEVNGTTTWQDAVAKVKSDNPKP